MNINFFDCLTVDQTLFDPYNIPIHMFLNDHMINMYPTNLIFGMINALQSSKIGAMLLSTYFDTNA